MRKLFILSLLFPSFFSVLSVSALVCTDIQVNLKRGNESKSVLALQTFLSEKKFLLAKPNGYFGPGTEKAVQAYQKSLGIPNSGAVYAMTRGAIKKETCGTAVTPIIPTTQVKSTSTASVVPSKVATTTPVKPTTPALVPVVTSVDKGIVFVNGKTEWQIKITGKNFATSTNTVYLQERKTSKRYTVGDLLSPDKTSILLPKSLGNIPMVCGTGCKKVLDPAEYFVVVSTKGGGESYPSAYIVVKGLESTSGTQTSFKALPYVATSTKIGVCNFIAYTPTTISLISFNLDQGKSTTTELSKIIFKNEVTGEVLLNGAAGKKMYEGEYLQVGIYANIETVATTTTNKTASCTLAVTDVNSKTSSITSPTFSVAFDSEPTYITALKNKKAPPELSSVEKVTVLTNGTTTWGVAVYGTGFSSTTNSIYLSSRINTKKYFVGTSTSVENRTKITLPLSLGTRTMKCGIGCEEPLPPGDYDVTIVNEYGESNQKQLQVKSFTTSATTGTLYKSFVKTVTNARLGTVNIGVGVPLKVYSITPTVKVIGGTSAISGLYLKDETTGTTLVAGGKDIQLSENDSKTYGIYGTISTTKSASAEVTVAFDVIDYLSTKRTVITSPAFIISLSALTE